MDHVVFSVPRSRFSEGGAFDFAFLSFAASSPEPIPYLLGWRCCGARGWMRWTDAMLRC